MDAAAEVDEDDEDGSISFFSSVFNGWMLLRLVLEREEGE